MPVEPGGLLLLIVESPVLQEEDLYEQELFRDNHKSFKATVDGSQPAMVELQGLIDSSFARLCTDSAEAERWLGKVPVISPLGNVAKFKPDGTMKNRLIQDFRASSVNSASSVSERQVLPRFVDHARDLAMLSARGSSVGVFVLDFTTTNQRLVPSLFGVFLALAATPIRLFIPASRPWQHGLVRPCCSQRRRTE